MSTQRLKNPIDNHNKKGMKSAKPDLHHNKKSLAGNFTHKNPISETAYYCCGARMEDALSPRPLLNDIYARKFMDDHGIKIFSSFKSMRRPNISSVVRSRIIEEYLKALLAKDPQLQIVIFGAGFDTKSFRVNGGHWIEIDEAPLISQKEKLLPAHSCRNPLTRIGVDFSQGELAGLLATIDNQRPTVFIIEGVFMYLSEQEIIDLINGLQKRFVRHLILCDLMNGDFIKKHMKTFSKKIAQFNCQLRFINKDPISLFANRGYSIRAQTSIVGKAIELKGFRIPWLLLKTYYSNLLPGYQVFFLDFNRAPAEIALL